MRRSLHREFLNRSIQIFVGIAPGERTLRPRLHRLRGVKMGKGCVIARHVVLETAWPNLVSIGDNSSLGLGVIIVAHFRDQPPGLTRLEPETVTVRIEKNVFIGPGCIILPNVTIGEGSVVNAGSVVTKSVPPKTMVQGNPAEPVAKCGIPLTSLKTTTREFYSHLRPIPGKKID